MFKEVDDIVRLGKWAYSEIPDGSRCRSCPLLGEASSSFTGRSIEGWCCKLRPSYGLIFDETGAFKDTACPKAPVKT